MLDFWSYQFQQRQQHQVRWWKTTNLPRKKSVQIGESSNFMPSKGKVHSPNNKFPNCGLHFRKKLGFFYLQLRETNPYPPPPPPQLQFQEEEVDHHHNYHRRRSRYPDFGERRNGENEAEDDDDEEEDWKVWYWQKKLKEKRNFQFCGNSCVGKRHFWGEKGFNFFPCVWILALPQEEEEKEEEGSDTAAIKNTLANWWENFFFKKKKYWRERFHFKKRLAPKRGGGGERDEIDCFMG